MTTVYYHNLQVEAVHGGRAHRLRSAEGGDKFTGDVSALLRSGCFLYAEIDVPAMVGFQIENCWVGPISRDAGLF